jgi:hypothetical protein
LDATTQPRPHWLFCGNQQVWVERAKVVAPAASPLSLYQKDDNFVRVKNVASYWFRRPSVSRHKLMDGRRGNPTKQYDEYGRVIREANIRAE